MTLIVAFLTKAARFYFTSVTDSGELHRTSQPFTLEKVRVCLPITLWQSEDAFKR